MTEREAAKAALAAWDLAVLAHREHIAAISDHRREPAFWRVYDCAADNATAALKAAPGRNHAPETGDNVCAALYSMCGYAGRR